MKNHVKKSEHCHEKNVEKESWKNFIPNMRVCDMAGIESIDQIILKRRTGWTGHVRMDEDRLPE